jgi:peptidoglycan/xylan/chitin deacetylase (PgdA/CDA1 family)
LRYRWLLVLVIVVIASVGNWYWFSHASQTNHFQIAGEFVYRIDANEKVVALTFDDGPRGPLSRLLLEELNRLEVKATFFVVGRQIKLFPKLTRDLWLSGHQLANHSYHHQPMNTERLWFFYHEIINTDALIRKSGYKGVIHFRAPMGKKRFVLPLLLSMQEKTHVLWDVNPRDYLGTAPHKMVQMVLNKVKPGSIVLLHDRENTLASLPAMVKGLQAKGYRFVTVDELLRLQR